MDILHSILFAGHMLGLAAIIGSFFVQMRRKSDFILGPTLYGAIVQLLTGVGLVGLAEAGDHDVNMVKIAVKLGIAAIVLVAAIVAVVVQRRGGKVQPWFHAAGGLAVINVLVAVFWR
ncbi:hypothetical protein PYV02_02420 [Leifsonia sp. H3M29-4]|uniref:hypothetical protein n=1 Tax=Salinibacterium metalliresistens TaxID=3031321 RepID=UPI0023DC49C9|nr:hypothetical protein [Salinibacterium metalliresistens]MDF1477933.1 hypothetical protein [Salinibacterium metalliresistens]